MTKLFVGLVVLVAMLVGAPRDAHAYAWMIRHAYTQCATCHADPVGGGLLTPYGRAQGEILLRMRYSAPPDAEPGALAEPLWGLVRLPNAVLLGGDARFAALRIMPSGSPAQSRFIVMQADAEAQVTVGRVRGNGSIGYVSEGGSGAALTRSLPSDPKLVSRVHWVGVDLGKDDEVLLRAGRMNLPFGLRAIEHTSFVRAETRTDTNASQSYGLEADYHRGALRAGGMLIAGNFAVSPDRFRSRGYAAFAEYALSSVAAVGVTSMVTNAKLDASYLTPTWRHAHGAFARYSPIRMAVVSAEWDFLFTSRPTPDTNTLGGVGLLQVDVEPIQGLHVGPSVEFAAKDFASTSSFGLWGSVWWFFLPHADVRLDLVGRSVGTPTGSANAITAIAQAHVYL